MKIRKGFGGRGIGYGGHTLYIKDYVLNNKEVHVDNLYLLETYIHVDDLKAKVIEMPECIVVQVPVHILMDCITVSELREMAGLHRVRLKSGAKKEINKLQFISHHCHACTTHLSLFTLIKMVKNATELTETEIETVTYPPSPANKALINEIIHGFCQTLNQMHLKKQDVVFVGNSIC